MSRPNSLWTNLLGRRGSARHNTRASRDLRKHRRLSLEPLESRQLLSTSDGFALVTPSPVTYTAGQNVSIQWTSSFIAGDSGSISLAYCHDSTAWSPNATWMYDVATPGNGSFSYTWNTAGLAGTYYLSGYLYDANANQSYYSELYTTPVVITAADSFAISTPSPLTYDAGQNVNIQWTSGIAAGHSAVINLAYAPNSTAWSPNATWMYNVATAINGVESYSWNTAAVAAGTYYLSGYYWDPAVGQPIYSELYTTPVVVVAADNFTISAPSPLTYDAGQNVNIQWTGEIVPGHSGQISLAYCHDSTSWSPNATWMYNVATAANGTESYSWNTTGLAGTYYLSGELWDATAGTPYYSELYTTPVTIIPADSFSLSTPSPLTYTAGQDVTIQWTSGIAAGHSGQINLAYCHDSTSWSPNATWMYNVATTTNGTESYSWNTTGLAGTYYLSGELWDATAGALPYYSELYTTPVTIIPADSFSLSTPSPLTYTAGQDVNIQWTSGIISGHSGSINLAYCTDSTPWSPNATWMYYVATAINGVGSYSWNTAGVAAGTYYLSGYYWDWTGPQGRPIYSELYTTPVTILPDATTMVLGASTTSPTYGQTVTLTATVSANSPGVGTPNGGTVQFLVNGTDLGSPVMLNDGTASIQTSTLTPGSYTISASYSGCGSFAATSASTGPQSIITTIAGDGLAGSTGDGGPATAAELSSPGSTAVDSAGDIFFLDSASRRVREVNRSTGIIATVVGNGDSGDSGDHGPATAAELANPIAIALDPAGDLFIADDYSETVREVNHSTGIITTVAGGGSSGLGDNGPATAAELGGPYGIAVDSSGHLFIADWADDRVREVNLSTGIIGTVAGNGTVGYNGDNIQATAAELDNPGSLAVDSSGDLFIVDTFDYRIRELNLSSGIISTAAGDGSYGSTGNGGQATAATLVGPLSLATDSSGDLLIADSQGGTVREVNSSTRIISTVAGNGTFGVSGDGGPATAAEFRGPCGVAVDSAGDLFIADGGSDRIREVAPGLCVTVAPAPLTVSGITASDKAYDGITAATLETTGATLSGVLPGDSVSLNATYATATFATTDAGDGIAVTVTGLGLNGPQAGDYTVVPPSLTADIDPAPLTVTANDAQKAAGDPDPTFTASYAGFVNGEGPGNLGGTLAFATDEPQDPTTAAPGTYDITPAGLTSDNYAITFVPGTLTVNPTGTPSFNVGANQAVPEDADAQAVAGWATDIVGTAGALTFSVDTDNDALFRSVPEVYPNGTLAYIPATGATGVADVSVTLYDAATQMASAPQYFTILVGGCVGLDNSSVFQGQAAGAVVGNLSATDADGDTSLSYSLVGGRVPFAIQGSQLVTTAALDYDAEPSYNVTVQATDSQGVSFQESFTIDVLDATLSIADQSAPEGSPLVFTASLSNALDHAVTIPYQLQQGTAPAGDYSDAGDGSVTIPAGSTSAAIRVTTVDDPANSSDVDFWVVLDPPSDLGGNDTVALGTMQYVAPVLPTISVADASAAAGGQIDFDVSLSSPAAEDTELYYNLDGGTAEFGKDYEDPGCGSVTIPQGATTASIVVATICDYEETNNVDFTVALQPSDAYNIGTGTATGTIQYAAPGLPSASVSSLGSSVDEGGPVEVPVYLSQPALGNVVVDYNLSGDASSGTDYTDVTEGSVMIPAGQTTGNIVIATHYDASNTESLDLSVALTGATGAQVDPGNAATDVTIGGWSEADGGGVAGDSGAAGTTLNIPVWAGGTIFVADAGEYGDDGNVYPMTVEYSTGSPGDTAIAGRDYQSTSGTLTFYSDEPQFVPVTTLDDTRNINDIRTFSLALTVLSGGGDLPYAYSCTGSIIADQAQGSLTVVGDNGSTLPHSVTSDPLQGGVLWVPAPGQSPTPTELDVNGFAQNPSGGSFTLKFDPWQVSVYTSESCSPETEIPNGTTFPDNVSTPLYIEAANPSQRQGDIEIDLLYKGNVLDSAYETAVQAYLTCNGTPVDPDTPINVEVGQQEALSIVTSPALSYTNWWNMSGGLGAAVAGFDPEVPATNPYLQYDKLGNLTAAYTYGPSGFGTTAPTQSSITIYWVAGGSQEVDVAPYFTGLDATQSLVANFDVDRPVVTATATAYSAGGVNQKGDVNLATMRGVKGMYFGGPSASGGDTWVPGMTFALGGWDDDLVSPVWCQVCTAASSNYAADLPTDLPVIDSGFPYPYSTQVGDAMDDSPGVRLPAAQALAEYTFSATFTTWLMCDADTLDSIAVPLAKATWSIEFTFVAPSITNNNEWTVTYANHPAATFVATTDFPSWNGTWPAS